MKSSLLSSTILASTVFATLTLPLALMGSKSVEVQVQNENVFFGTVRDVAVPYLGLVGLISVGAGAASVSMSGWKNSHRKSAQIREQLSAIQQELKDKEVQIENLRLTEANFRKSGLDQFLESLPIQEPVYVTAEPTQATQLQPEVELHSIAPAVPMAVANGAVKAREAIAVAPVESAPARLEVVASPAGNGVVHQFTELQSQLKYMAEQIETLQTVFQEKPETVAHSVSVAPSTPTPAPVAKTDAKEDPSTLMIEHLHRRLQQLESHWMREQFAS